MSDTKIRNMEEFAAISGISRPTLSKYFNDPDSVRQSTRARIERAVEKHGYQPNVFAVNQNRNRTKNIGIVVPYLADPFFSKIGREVEETCMSAGYRPVLLSSHGSAEIEKDNLNLLKGLKPAGVLLAPLGDNSDRDAIRRFADEVPLMLFDADIDDTGMGFVGADNYQSIDLMVEYLCRSGEPPCFFEMRTPSNPNANTRHRAYIDSMERRGFTPHLIRAEGDGWEFEEIGQREGGRVLAARGLPTNTVLCSNDRLAIGFLAAAYKQGLRVGHGSDCSLRVAGHDDHPYARFTCPSLTTIAQNYSAIAHGAVESLLRLLEVENPAPGREVRHFDGRLVMRDSA